MQFQPPHARMRGVKASRLGERNTCAKHSNRRPSLGRRVSIATNISAMVNGNLARWSSSLNDAAAEERRQTDERGTSQQRARLPRRHCCCSRCLTNRSRRLRVLRLSQFAEEKWRARLGLTT